MGFEINGPGLPPGGAPGEALIKLSAVNYDVGWGPNIFTAEQQAVVTDLTNRIGLLESDVEYLRGALAELKSQGQ